MTVTQLRSRNIATALLLFALMFTACGGSSDTSGSATTTDASSSDANGSLDDEVKALKQEDSTRFVGKVEGTDAFIGVKNRAGVVTAYLCDSKELAVWMTGTASGDTFTAASGPVSLTGTLGSGAKQLTGSVTLADGSKHAFTADLATGSAGLYEARGPDGDGIVRAGWVRLASGEQRGAAKTGTIVRPTTQVSDALTVALGGRPMPVIPPPGPVTSKADYCQTLRDLFSQIQDIKIAREKDGLDTTDQTTALKWLSQEYTDQKCAAAS